MRILLICTLFVSLAPAFGSQAVQRATTADEVMAKVFARDRQREKASQGYTGTRRYIFENEGWKKHAEMVVSVKGEPDGSKHFEVVSEEGWKSANKRVLRKMLESESETSRPGMRSTTLLSPENYTFSLAETVTADPPTYVIDVVPKRHDKYLFKGRIWVNGLDYAVMRCEGSPAKNASFWIHSVHFVHRYSKTGDFWFPSTTDSLTDARIFGATSVAIQYFDYAPNVVPLHELPSLTDMSLKVPNVSH